MRDRNIEELKLAVTATTNVVTGKNQFTVKAFKDGEECWCNFEFDPLEMLAQSGHVRVMSLVEKIVEMCADSANAVDTLIQWRKEDALEEVQAQG